MANRKPYVGGNWKMNCDRNSASDLARSVADGLKNLDSVDAVVFPPFCYLQTVAAILRDRGSTVRLGGQDLYHQPNGAFTGEISASMLHDCSAASVLVGHSERRHVIGETDELINLKVKAAIEAELECVLCIGETLEQREAAQTDAVNERQLRTGLAEVDSAQMRGIVVAYEPVWAIGTGKTATPDDAQAAHLAVRHVLTDMFGADVAQATRIIYGGSVKAANAAELFGAPDIDGGLIGGASLRASDFTQIVRAAAQ